MGSSARAHQLHQRWSSQSRLVDLTQGGVLGSRVYSYLKRRSTAPNTVDWLLMLARVGREYNETPREVSRIEAEVLISLN